MNAKLSNLHTKSCFPWLYFSVFCALWHFLLIFVFVVCLCCFSFRSCFHILRLLSQMLRLEFHVNQRRLKRHHRSISSWLTASPLGNQSKRGGDVTPMCVISCLVQVKMDYCQLGNIFPYRTPLYVAICHCCTSTWRSVNIKWAILVTSRHVRLYLFT